jgi:hypothetical protein
MSEHNNTNDLYFISIFPEIFSTYFDVTKNFYKKINDLITKSPEKFKQILDKIERELDYEDGAYGITEIISCPIKAELRRKGIEVKVENVEIADGFSFENMFKFALMEYFGVENVEPEKLLKYKVVLDDGREFNINGHLDVFINIPDKNTVVGLELKDTILSFDNTIWKDPPPFKILSPDDAPKYNISSKYILQARIQRKILEHLYPDKNIETYLIVKTNLRAKYKLKKSILVYPVTTSISDEQLKEIVSYFINNRKPRYVFECKICPYKEQGYCNGFDTEELENDKSLYLDDIEEQRKEHITELLERRENLLKEVNQIEEQLKKHISGTMEYKGKTIGWVESVKREYDARLINKILKQKGIPPEERAKFFQINWRKLDDLKGILTDEEFKKAIVEKKIKKWKI